MENQCESVFTALFHATSAGDIEEQVNEYVADYERMNPHLSVRAEINPDPKEANYTTADATAFRVTLQIDDKG